MSYTRTNWREGETPLSAQNMNNIEDGIEELQAQKVDKVSGKALSDQNYTAAEKTKLAGIAAGAEVNQNAFAFVDIESGSATALEATSKRDTVTFIAGSNVTMTASPGNNIVTINAADTTYSNATTSAAGLMSAADKTKLNGIAAGAQVNRTYTAVTGKPTSDLHPGFGTTIIVSQVSQNANGQISVTDRPIEFPDQVATTSERGLMTPADVTKLNGIETGAKSIKTIELTIAESVTIAANSLSTSGPKFWSTALSGKTILGYRSLKLWNSSGSAATIIPFNMTLTKNGTTGAEGIILWAYNPTSASITIKDTSKCTIIYV